MTRPAKDTCLSGYDLRGIHEPTLPIHEPTLPIHEPTLPIDESPGSIIDSNLPRAVSSRELGALFGPKKGGNKKRRFGTVTKADGEMA